MDQLCFVYVLIFWNRWSQKDMWKSFDHNRSFKNKRKTEHMDCIHESWIYIWTWK